VHDIVNLEGRGVPAFFIASSQFVQAAQAQSEALGMTPLALFVEHPIQDRTDEEMREIARGAMEKIVGLLVG
jgi:hypothetical protein